MHLITISGANCNHLSFLLSYFWDIKRKSSITAQHQLPPPTKLVSVADLCGTMNRPLFPHFMSSLMHLIGELSKLSGL